MSYLKDLIKGVKGRAVAEIQAVPRRAAKRITGVETVTESVTVVSKSGYKIAAKIHRPVDGGSHHGVLLVPGTNDTGDVFLRWSQPINAMELASMGLVVMTFDPAGRGDSWGEEDYGGIEHQDDVVASLVYLSERSDTKDLGVVSISLGLAMACGALANLPEGLEISWFVDWEGPCDREIITAGGAIMVPAMGHSLNDDVYWMPREALKHVGSIKCGYHRLQAVPDHAQPKETRHATRMIQEVSTGEAAWFKINNHARGSVPDAVDWLRPGRLAANRAITAAVMDAIRSS
jgi:hypothetical protein